MMITFELTSEDRNELYAILSGVRSDLRMEIAGTDSADFRESLKRRQMCLEKLLAHLEVGTSVVVPRCEDARLVNREAQQWRRQ